mgnify:CR=1 FL=1
MSKKSYYIATRSLDKIGQDFLDLLYCLSKKAWPIIFGKLLYKMGQDFLDKLNLQELSYAFTLSNTVQQQQVSENKNKLYIK